MHKEKNRFDEIEAYAEKIRNMSLNMVKESYFAVTHRDYFTFTADSIPKYLAPVITWLDKIISSSMLNFLGVQVIHVLKKKAVV